MVQAHIATSNKNMFMSCKVTPTILSRNGNEVGKQDVQSTLGALMTQTMTMLTNDAFLFHSKSKRKKKFNKVIWSAFKRK